MQTHPPAKHTAVHIPQVNVIATNCNVWFGHPPHPARLYGCHPFSCGMEQPRSRLTNGGGGGGYHPVHTLRSSSSSNAPFKIRIGGAQ